MVRNKKNCATQHRRLGRTLFVGAFCNNKRRQIPSIAAPGYTARVNACVTSVNQRNANHWLRSIETNTLLW